VELVRGKTRSCLTDGFFTAGRFWMSFQAIGNVEPYATVAIKARIDG
jgi:hypothetical protein